MGTETGFVLLFVVATGVAIAARRLRLPYTVALVVAGLVLGIVHLFEPPPLTRDLLYAVFLPGLLFEAAFHLEFADFWRDRVPVAALAVPGVAVGVGLTALILVPAVKALGLGAGFGWMHGIVFGALIAATDPIAVVAMFGSLGAPRRLTVLMKGESLINDGTAIVVFALVLDVVAGKAISPVDLGIEFVRITGGGLAVGVLVGLGASQVIRHVDDPMIEITLTTIAAYGSFLAAEASGLSGVIATVAAGMLCGNYAARTGMSPSTRIAAETFWEYIAFALNSVVFLLMGLRVHIADLAASWALILAAYAAVILARSGVVFGVAALNRSRRRQAWPTSWNAIITWGGMRGGLSMVLALGLPASLPQRDLLITVTFGVALLSILAQGLTMAPLLRRLGVVSRHDARRKYHVTHGELRMTGAGLAEIERMERTHAAPPAVLQELRSAYEERRDRATAAVDALQVEREDLRAEQTASARRRVLLAEKEEILDDARRGALSTDAYRELLAGVDARLSRLDAGMPAGPGGAGSDEPADSEAARPAIEQAQSKQVEAEAERAAKAGDGQPDNR